jgi:hypothetical protein
MAKIQIGDKGWIRCEVRGFGAEDPKMKKTGLHLPRSICVEARGHLIWIFETEFVPDSPPAESPDAPEKPPPIDP